MSAVILLVDVLPTQHAMAVLREARMQVLLDTIVQYRQPPCPDVRTLVRVEPAPEVEVFPGGRSKRKGCGRHKGRRWSR